jgi:hypothetical protein
MLAITKRIDPMEKANTIGAMETTTKGCSPTAYVTVKDTSKR